MATTTRRMKSKAIALPPVVPPLPRERPLRRDLPLSAPFAWLGLGWRDLVRRPLPSIAYGFAIFAASIVFVGCLYAIGLDYILFPALSGFMVVAPVIAVGLYEKSRHLAAGKPVTLGSMLFVRAESNGQILFIGVILALLVLLWMRAAVIVYALFFGLTPFPGLGGVVEMLFTTPTGWAMLVVGTAVGGLFAAFSFAIGAFSIPMLLNERLDAFTAMGTSMAIVWNNLAVMLVWAALVMILGAFSLATGFVGLVLVFPLLGHATWHAYRAIRVVPASQE